MALQPARLRDLSAFCVMHISAALVCHFPKWRVYASVNCPMVTRWMFLSLVLWATTGCAPRAGEFAGTWRLTRTVSRGKETRIAAATAPLRVFDGLIAETRPASTGPGKASEVSGRARYWIDASRTPKTINLEYVEGPATGTMHHGIYEISGDSMKICVALNGGPTPTSFESPIGSETNVDFYERVK
jgi:uncharacterized protein (TIGR03067 family)